MTNKPRPSSPARAIGIGDEPLGEACSCAAHWTAEADDAADAADELLASIERAEASALAQHQAGTCHLPEWSCSYCATTEDARGACRCDYAHIGTQMDGEPICCERCHGLVDDVAAARMDAMHAEALARLERRSRGVWMP